MNVFETHKKIVADYSDYIQSFINIADSEIEQKVRTELGVGKLWPNPLLHFNPAFQMAGKVEDFVERGILHCDAANIFQGYSLYKHQLEAIQLGSVNRDFIVTSGTGSGKSLTYISTIFNHLLHEPDSKGVTAVIVYPMNALINSQSNELEGYRQNYETSSRKSFPIQYGQYTGQEKEGIRQRMRDNPPQILLTNYMMLELLLTRLSERGIRDAIYENLKYLIFDELHTYRGRQGADVAMLIRRIQSQCKSEITCIGTSATMVSVGSNDSQRQQVADVATKIFGRKFEQEQIVNETLSRSLDHSTSASSDLAASIVNAIDTDADENTLRSHPVAVWIENNIALEETASGLLRRKPMQINEVVTALANASGQSEELCFKRLTDILLWISKVNQQIQAKGSRYTLLPFKLHQFFAQTGSVYTTLDQGEERFITLEPGLYKEDEKPKKPIYPNVFSRESGVAFICASIVDNNLAPREFKMSADDDLQANDGYLLIGEDIWDPETDYDNLPDSWFRVRANDRVPDTKYADRFPQKLYFDEYGNCSKVNDKPYVGWFLKAPLLFDPTAGVFFDTRTNEGTKLTKLGSEGRSTSTTITTFSILNQLNDAGCSAKDQKLLSFTDNRQDAALQAGHFNDFVQVVKLRSSIYYALSTAEGNKLDYSNIGAAIFKSLNLGFTEYSTAVESPFPHVRAKYEDTFQNFLFYRALADLRRSWRIVLPNLEQCGLITVDYKYIDEVVGHDDAWKDVPIVRSLSVDERREFIITILDFFRLEQAIHSENFLTREKLGEFEKRFREQLVSPWGLDEKEKLNEPYVVRLDTLQRNIKLYSKSIGPQSSVGKYIKQFVKLHPNLDVNEIRGGDNYRRFMLALLEKLEAADYLIRQDVKSSANETVPVFRLKIDQIEWTLGDGETVRADAIKRRTYKDLKPRPNIFFRELYKRDFSQMKRFRAEDHTGQLSVADRRDREERFRADWFIDDQKIPDEAKIRTQSISALYCSPTMELGVDIGGLSVVHMRNAPPNPANYAQRSGRAGRNGQGALIFTYCSSYSPHDRHYFQLQTELVAGTVQAPRIDLTNEELLRTHLNALAISEIGLPGLEAARGESPSLIHFVDSNAEAMSLRSEVRAGLRIGPETKAKLENSFKRAIKGLEDQLKKQEWFSDTWIGQQLDNLADQLDASLKRWRDLYASARLLLSKATQPIESGLLVVGSEEYRKYKRLQDQANRQLNLLRNDQSGNDLSEFYPYRYLAAEGFLPGYNFTRLPVRVFVPSSSTGGDFISRSRELGLREFGPLNVIYHNGGKFQISQMIVQDAENNLKTAVVSKKSGYFLIDEELALEHCPFSGESLHDNASKIQLHDMLEMSESRAEQIDRISCEEEERVSKGFNTETYFSVDGGNMDRVQKAEVKSTEASLLNLRYIPAARLWHINTKWRSQQIDGFPIGLVSGDWFSSMPDLEARKEQVQLVKLFTSNVTDALYIEPIAALGLKPDGVITLQYALKRAIEEVFQVEPNEIGVMAMGDPEMPNIMLCEISEGNLGILSRFVRDIDVFRKVIEKAEAICRFDDPEYNAPASYNDLLSYYNQRDHSIIDRFKIKDALEKLKISTLEIQTNKSFRSYDEHYAYMMENLDPSSSTEKVFIKYLYDNGLRLPDFAQKRVDGIYCQPDFYYDPERVWIFCDGTPHDDPEIKQRDHEQRQLIIAKGDEVWFWHYREDLAAKVASRPDIFKKVR